MSTPMGIHVLHVDDEPDFVDIGRNFLQREDDRITVETATSASDGLDRLNENDIDCVVSDHNMPGMNGVDFLKTVREQYDDLPFILFTGKGTEDIASDAISAGVTDYLQKGSGTEKYELLANRITNAASQRQAHQLAAETEQRLQELSEATTDILWMFTADWSELLFTNSAYEELWGRSIDTLADHPTDFLNGVHPDDQERIKAAMDRVSNGQRVDVEIRVNPDEDHQRWVWIQGAPITDENGTVVRATGFVRDITEQKEREQKLERQNERLEKFASVVSHDLRNPLNVVQGRLELAHEECDSVHLDKATSAVDRSFTLIDDLLTLAREGEAVHGVEAVDLRETIEGYWQNIGTKGATLVTETDQTIRADGGRLRQLLENLIRNAVEHGGNEVTITIGDLDDGFYIADNGPGIPAGEREQVFEPGYSTTDDGTGFGLNIVQDIVEAHDWQIRVTESNDGGTQFEITDVEFVE